MQTVLFSTWWCCLHCIHTFWLQLCITMLHTYTPIKTSTANQMALQQGPVENQITCTAMARNETFLLHCRGSRQLRARTAPLPSYLAHHSVLYLQHLPVNSFSSDTTCWGLNISSLSSLFIVFNSTYTPPTDCLAGIVEDWADALVSAQRLIFSHLFFYLAEKPLAGVVSQRKLVFSLLWSLIGFSSTDSSSS